MVVIEFGNRGSIGKREGRECCETGCGNIGNGGNTGRIVSWCNRWCECWWWWWWWCWWPSPSESFIAGQWKSGVTAPDDEPEDDHSRLSASRCESKHRRQRCNNSRRRRRRVMRMMMMMRMVVRMMRMMKGRRRRTRVGIILTAMHVRRVRI